MENIGQRIRLLRKQLSKSQEDFAKELDITKQAISNMENSKSAPSISALYKMQTKMGVNLNYLIAGVGDIFVEEKNMDSLKASLFKDFENLLKSRGIQ